MMKHQKCLVLSNLKELHVAWNESHPDKKVGFSKFAALRPRWCVLAGLLELILCANIIKIPN